MTEQRGPTLDDYSPIATSRVSRFLFVSYGDASSRSLREPSEAAVRELSIDGEPVSTRSLASGWLAAAGIDLRSDRSAECVSLGSSLVVGKLSRTRSRDLSPAELVQIASTSPSRLVDVLPPFALLHQRRDDSVIAAVDWLGFQQIYVWSGQDVAAVSTSARALAALAGVGYDEVSLATQAMMGWQIGDRTLFDGVVALPPATVATLRGGEVSLRTYAQMLDGSSQEECPTVDDAVEEMAEILREWLDRYLSDHPNTVLQLTGGHDSRILLGAVPAGRRRGLHALTLGDGESCDVAIAADLCRREGMTHMVRPVDRQEWPRGATVHDLVMNSSRALDGMASPLALAPILSAEAGIEQGDRFCGLGGEVARGFYYAGLAPWSTTSAKRIDRLARWRLFSNEAVERGALDDVLRAAAVDSTITALTSHFPQGDWRRATDAFYLYQRMHRWAGVHGSVAAARRRSVNPMFDRRFIELAMVLPPHEKRDSLLLGKLMSRLDPELAGIALDVGLVPRRLGTRSPITRIAIVGASGRRAASKAWQRATDRRRPQIGANSASDILLEHWRSCPRVCDPLLDLSVIDSQWMRGLLRGSVEAHATTIAFLANMLATSEVSAG